MPNLVQIQGLVLHRISLRNPKPKIDSNARVSNVLPHGTLARFTALLSEFAATPGHPEGLGAGKKQCLLLRRLKPPWCKLRLPLSTAGNYAQQFLEELSLE